MSTAQAWTLIAGLIGSFLVFAGVVRTNRSTDRSADVAAAQALRGEADKKLEQAWESRLALKAEMIEELQRDLAAAVKRIEELVLEVAALKEQLEARGMDDGSRIQ